MFELDKYAIRARIYPTFIVLLPAFIVSLYYITDFERYYHYFTALIGIGLFTFLLSQLGRDLGKRKEPRLFKFFGGKPTTTILRHRDNYLDNVTKERYHKLLSMKIEGIQIPSKLQESVNPDGADQVYESCVKYLISKTRDTNKFNLLFKENISYGFRRNLWGMKPFAIVLTILCLCIHFYLTTNRLTILNEYDFKSIGLFSYLSVSLLFWLFVVTKTWTKLTAFAYAERLLESLNDL